MTGNVGRSDAARAFDAVVDALNSPTGRTVTDAAQLTGLVPGFGAVPAALGAVGRTIGSLGARFGFGGPQPAEPDPALEAAFQAQREGERNFTPEAPLPDEPPGVPGPGPDPTGLGPGPFGDEANLGTLGPEGTPGSPGPSGPGPEGDPGGLGPSGPSGDPSGEGEGGPGGGGPGGGGEGGPGGGGGEGDGGGGGDFARGGRVGRGHPKSGAWKGAKRFAVGGGVPTAYYDAAPPESERQARARRMRAFELAHANTPV